MVVRTKDIIKIYLNHVKPYKWALFLLFSLSIAAEVAGVIVPIYYKKLFDTLADTTGDIPAAVSVLVGILVAILLLNAVSWAFYRVARIMNNHYQPSVMADLEKTGFSYLLDHSAAFFADSFTGSLVRKVRRLSRSYEDFSDVLQWDLIPLAVVLVGSLAVIWTRSPLIAGIIAVWLVIFTVVNYYVARWRLKYDEKRAAIDSEVTGVLADAVTNTNNIRLFANKKYEEDLFSQKTAAHRKITTLSWNIADINDAVQWGLVILIEFAALFVAVRLWSQEIFTIGDFALLQGYLIAIFSHIHRLGRIIRRTYEAFADAKEMVEILHTPHEIKDKPNAKPLVVTDGRIDFENVNFQYRKTRYVFKDFNLAIKPREKVALVGPSGSGKTTIVQLLLRLHDVQKGQIDIDGQNIANVPQDSLRQHISLVPQNPVLFHRSLKENIRYGNLKANDKDVIKAAKSARCHDFIAKLPEGYNTFVGERGIKLSGGERQRVAIARAILEDARILILDEATSSLDSESEALIQEALAELMKEKTAIVIAHRLSTILKMDRIIVVSKGEVVDSGTHAELMAKKGGLYRKLWEIQSSGFIE